MTNNGVEYVLSLKDLFTSKIRGATQETEKLNGAVNMAKNALAGLGGAYVVGEIVKTTAAFEGLNNQLAFATGSAQKGAEEMEWLRERSQYLGLDLQTTANAFAKFSGAARNTSIEGAGVRNIFEGVAMAATTMHLSAEQADGTFMALQQMLSKGKVSAEELNGQLGERLPGALGIASRAMGVTQAELMKMMQSGQLMSEDFLPKFGAQLRKEFGDASNIARESLTANINRMNSALFELKATLGEALLPVIQLVLDVIIGIGDAIKNTISFIKEYSIVFGVAATAMLSYYTYTKLAAIWTGIQMVRAVFALSGATIAQTVAQWGLNAATAVFDALTGNVWALTLAGVTAAAVGVWMYKKKQEDLNAELAKTKQLQSGLNAAVNPLAPKGTQQPQTATKGATKGGTSTSAVESRGVQNFNINIQKLVENLTFQTTNLKESGAAIKEEVAKALIEAVNDFQLMATK